MASIVFYRHVCPSAVAHLRFHGYLDAHVDGELDDSWLAHAVADHVTRCPTCAGAARTTMVVKQRLSLQRLLPSHAAIGERRDERGRQ